MLSGPGNQLSASINLLFIGLWFKRSDVWSNNYADWDQRHFWDDFIEGRRVHAQRYCVNCWTIQKNSQGPRSLRANLERKKPERYYRFFFARMHRKKSYWLRVRYPSDFLEVKSRFHWQMPIFKHTVVALYVALLRMLFLEILNF